MALGVVLLDVLKLCRLFECRMVPVEVSQPLVQVRIPASNITNVALEVLHVNRVKTDDRREEPDIRFGDCRRRE